MAFTANQLKKTLASQVKMPVTNDKISNRLIKDLEIQNGFGLAKFLEIEANVNNFTALRIWVNKRCNQISADNNQEIYILKVELLETVPHA